MAVDQKAYRRYHATIERSLALFDASSDWADYIAFLTRLLKSLETGKPAGLTDVPCKSKISLCLARCLQPSLPSGVHQKALDVYNEIFTIIGVDGLSKDLALYLPGFCQTLGFANLSTRPMVLDLFDSYILKLPPSSLRPALKALILSLLPVIEEETSEDFDRCLQTFSGLRARFVHTGQESFFWQTLFVASISNPVRRPGVLVYLNRYLPKLQSEKYATGPAGDTVSPPERNVIITPEPGLLVRCFATGLRDEQALVQRGFLDLLVTHLPLDATVLQDSAYRKDLDVLVAAAMMVVLRRDMSLNRRLWAWFTGTDSKASDMSVTSPINADKQSELHNNHFLTFGLESTVRSMLTLINVPSSAGPGSRSLPFRIMLSLLDRWDIGGPVVKASFAPMMGGLLLYQSSAPSQDAFDEVFRSTNVFFDAIESATMFECLSDLLQKDDIGLVAFIISNFGVEQADSVHIHASRLVKLISQMALQKHEKQFELACMINDLVAIMPANSFAESDSSATHSIELVSDLLEALASILCMTLEQSEAILILPIICAAFDRLIALAPSGVLSKSIDSQLSQCIIQCTKKDRAKDLKGFVLTDACSKIVSSILQRLSDMSGKVQYLSFECIPSLVARLWDFLGDQTPQCHVAAVEDIWRLRDLTSEAFIVESTIFGLLCVRTDDMNSTKMQIERFGTLYHHSKTLKRNPDDTALPMLQQATLRILDAIDDQDCTEPGVQWLLGLNTVTPIFNAVFDAHSDDIQDMSLTVGRVQKLVKILRSSEDHWRLFSSSPDMQKTQAFTLSLIDGKKNETAFVHDAYALIRILYGSRSGNIPPEDLINLLIKKLGAGNDQTSSQEEILDTSLAILNDKSVLPTSLVQILLKGFSTIPTDERLDKWITLLCNSIPNHAALLPSLLKVTNSFCKRIDQTFEDLQSTFDGTKVSTTSKSPERSIANLLSGLEYVLARAHQQVFQDGSHGGHLTNGIVSEKTTSRSRANDQLTVILCIQDAVRICARLWAWNSVTRSGNAAGNKAQGSDIKSFQYVAMKLRSRSRKILENLIEAESQECLETLIGMWTSKEHGSIMNLLQTLNGARPGSMMPAIFSAIYNRTNPAALDKSQKSTLSIQVSSFELVNFLNVYTAALDDDMLEEIWTDCASFLREVLGNPMPHRQLLIRLVRFCSVLARKMENTNFSEESRMYRELADVCARLFTAIFTIKPTGYDGSTSVTEATNTSRSNDDNMLITLVDTLPHLGPVLSQYDRNSVVFTGVLANIISPAMHARAFPANLSLDHLEVMRLMAGSSGTAKTWRKELIDGFSSARFFQSSVGLATGGWLPVMKLLQVTDKTLVGDCLNRLTPPAAAGLMFGVGATAARTEADRKTQLELQRITLLTLAADEDAMLPHLQLILQKLEELLSATPESSPSLAIRGDLYMLIRALLLKLSHSNLHTVWPLLNSELQSMCKDILAGSESRYSDASKLQGAKLLDLLLLMRPDEFQLHEWLFVTDTIDAIYPSGHNTSAAYADEIAPMLNQDGVHFEPLTADASALGKPWFHNRMTQETADTKSMLAGFFSQLSIRAFEDLYGLKPLDEEACRQDLLADLFSDTNAQP